MPSDSDVANSVRRSLQVEAGFRRHRLDHLRDLLQVGLVRHHQVERDRRRDAGFLDQRLGLLDVALRDREFLDVVRIGRARPLIARRELAVEHDLVERVAVDGELERLAHLGVLAERILRLIGVGEIDGEPGVGEARTRRELQPGVAAHGRDVGREQPLHQIERAGAQVGEPHRAVRHREIGDAIDVDAVLVPIVGEAVEHDAFLHDALDEAERPGADRLGDELVAGLLHGLRADHHAGAVGELRDQRRERRLEQQPDRQRVGHLDLVDLRQLGLAERALHGHVPVERELRPPRRRTARRRGISRPAAA